MSLESGMSESAGQSPDASLPDIIKVMYKRLDESMTKINPSVDQRLKES